MNLAIGSGTTLFAVYILWQLIFSHPTIEFKNLYDTIGFFLPRITLAIFIEIFAFFFLRIYKKNLDDIKYFQNEQTNVDSKLLALKSAFWTKDQDTLRQVILELIKTERNFIIKKDETTIGLKTIEIENDQDKKIYDLVSSIFNSKKT